MDAEPFNDTLLPDAVIERLADALWAKITGAGVDGIDLNLRAKLALEQRLLPTSQPPFGLDRLSTNESASYIGVEPATLHDKAKRRVLGVPPPFHIGRKLFWRRSELDQWIEQQKEQRPGTAA